MTLANRFAYPKAAYEVRLAGIKEALAAAAGEEREPLLAHAENIAHNLAGTATIFGEPKLGESAAAVEGSLWADNVGGSDCIPELFEAVARRLR